ncbi:Ankyrin repeat domain-containing protein 50 [Hondaea fermentalgiana]|uniref:Ankyrin repeat domain-containing protein 50 n=1 Tax=Hondaea fermentalgiana TaxID=2315210 RepID=A0A2R5GF78_9STRA|nr:Ankyrin repeat domain-containing protein 50 [Hondaea fermentalgiana]|eukprot:GBG26494.1 Ankyrin repeat domain-containing protein 50 [Hondaea fermentalgiana]
MASSEPGLDPGAARESQDVVAPAVHGSVRDQRHFEQLVARYDFEEALWMVDAGQIDANHICAGGETLLSKASGAGEMTVVAALLQHGAKADHANSSNRSGLMKAAAGGHAKVVDLLLKTHQVDIFRKDTSGRSPLDWARMARHKSCAHLLEEEINQSLVGQRRRLADAARRKKLEANVFAENKRLAAEMQHLIRENDLEEIYSLVVDCKLSRHTFERAIVERHKLVDCKDNNLSERDHQESKDASGVRDEVYYIDVQIEGGMTALHRAAAADRLELISLLIHHGAQVNLASLAAGHTALTWAAACGQYGAVQSLLVQGADLEHRTVKDRKNALMYAIANGHSRVAMLIVDHALNLAMQQRDDLLAAVEVSKLDTESAEKYKDWSSFFLDLIRAADAQGRDASEYARMMGDTDVQEVLQEAVDRTMEIQLVDAHILHESGTCPNRVLPCLLDYVGRRVRYGHGGEIGYVLSYNPESGTHRVRPSSDGKAIVEARLGDPSGLLHDVQAMDLASWTCGTMRACEREQHLATCCPKRKLECPNQCGQIMQEEQLAGHLAEGCVRRIVDCPNPGCEAEMLHCNLWVHVNSECQFQKVKCSCGEWIDKVALPVHAIAECQVAKTRCLLGCSAYVERESMQDHLDHHCPKRVVQCRFGCGIERMWAEEQQAHEEQECALRLVECGQCGEKDACTFQELAAHKQETCKRRPIPCECGEKIPLDELEKHKTSLCPKRRRWCALGCGEMVPEDETEEHEELLCKNRVEDCRLGCGIDVRMSRRPEHEVKECRRRPMACPNHCGDIVRAEALDDHLKICSLRKVPCGAESAACTRSLRAWMTSEVDRGAARLVLCEEHQETCLSFACGRGELELVATILAKVENLPHSLSKTPMDRAEELRCKRARMAEICSTESRVGHSPVTRAAMHGHLHILEHLAGRGADLARETSRGRTPLLEAIMYGHVEVVEFLLEEAVPVDEKNKNGLIPLALAQRLGNNALVQIIQATSEFRKGVAALFQNIMLCNLEALDALLDLGEPHFPDQQSILRHRCDELASRIKVLSSEKVDLEEQRDGAMPGFTRRQSQLLALQEEYTALEKHIESLERACDEVENDVLGPLLKAATRSLQFVHSEDVREVEAYSEPTHEMHLVMQAVCILLGIEPKQKRDLMRSSITTSNYWDVARQQIVRDENLKRRLTLLLANGRADPSAVKRCEGVLEQIDETIKREQGVSFDELCAQAAKPFIESDGSLEENESSSAGGGDEGNERLQLIDSLNIWAHAVVAKHTLTTGSLLPKRQEASSRRGELNKLKLVVDEAEHQARFAESKVLAATVPLADVDSELVTRTQELSDTRAQLDCVRLLSARTQAGHTALSWAAMYGDVRVIELLLERGAAVDYEDDHRAIAATLVQATVRHYLKRKHRPAWTRALASQFRNEDLVFFYQLRRLAARHRRWRQSSRTPLSHALYNGHAQCARLLLLRGARLERESPVFPVGPIPYRFPTPWPRVNARMRRGNAAIFVVDELSEEELTRLRLLGHEMESVPEERQAIKSSHDVAQAGVRYQDRLAWKHGVGWDEIGPNREALQFVQEEARKHEEHLARVQEHERERKEKAAEVDKVRKLNASMADAVLKEDFEKVVRLVESGASIDFEVPGGHTALTYAAWRGTESTNKDDERVLAVEMLSDLALNAPNVNRETSLLHTALSMASKAGRINVMEALLKRGAIPDAVLGDGKTALIHAAAAGKWEACRLLLEHGADLDRKDVHGKTAIEHARRSNFVEVVRQLSQVRYGNLGRAVAQRGQANEVVICGWGCGAKLRVLPKSYFSRTMTRTEIENEEDPDFIGYHEAQLCPKRPAECPYNCGITEMWAEERHNHVTVECPNRPAECPNGCGATDVQAHNLQRHVEFRCVKRRIPCLRCDEMVILEKMHVHDKSDCPMRAQICENGCGAVLPWNKYSEHRRKLCPEHFVEAQHLDKHLRRECVRRFVKCQGGCILKVPFADMERHLETECAERLVWCPNYGCPLSKTFEGGPLAGPDTRLRHRQLAYHLEEECQRRLVRCAEGCGEDVPLSSLPDHKRYSCTKRKVTCRVGCPKMMPFDELETHEKYECRKRIAWCRLGCNATMPAEKLNRHERRECPKRVVLCSLGCGEEIRAEDRELHEREECIRRTIASPGLRNLP